jgi:hypothetical protein
MDFFILPISNLLQASAGGRKSSLVRVHVLNPSAGNGWNGLQAHRRVKFIACGFRVKNIWYMFGTICIMVGLPDPLLYWTGGWRLLW